MASIFLDANIIIDFIERRKERELAIYDGHDVFVSVLSIHILTYVAKSKIPDQDLTNTLRSFILASFTHSIALKALEGPTKDFEDNVQLHSAAEAGCDVFLTQDKYLLAMKFFGTMRIAETVSV